jgi:hypothetical protein
MGPPPGRSEALVLRDLDGSARIGLDVDAFDAGLIAFEGE